MRGKIRDVARAAPRREPAVVAARRGESRRRLSLKTKVSGVGFEKVRARPVHKRATRPRPGGPDLASDLEKLRRKRATRGHVIG